MKVVSNVKKVTPVIFEKIDKWSLENLWETDIQLFSLIQDDVCCIVLDIKQMQNLARIFDKTITDIIGKEVHSKLQDNRDVEK